MRRKVILTGAVLGLAVTVPLVALMYLGERLVGLPMPAFDLLQAVTRIQALGGVVTKMIELMVSVFSGLPGVATDVASKTFEQFSAILLFLVLGAIAGAIFAANRPTSQPARRNATNLGLVAWILTFGFEILTKPAAPELVLILAIWLGILYVGWAY